MELEKSKLRHVLITMDTEGKPVTVADDKGNVICKLKLQEGKSKRRAIIRVMLPDDHKVIVNYKREVP